MGWAKASLKFFQEFLSPNPTRNSPHGMSSSPSISCHLFLGGPQRDHVTHDMNGRTVNETPLKKEDASGLSRCTVAAVVERSLLLACRKFDSRTEQIV